MKHLLISCVILIIFLLAVISTADAQEDTCPPAALLEASAHLFQSLPPDPATLEQQLKLGSPTVANDHYNALRDGQIFLNSISECPPAASTWLAVLHAAYSNSMHLYASTVLDTPDTYPTFQRLQDQMAWLVDLMQSLSDE